jgi:hypothetical protein
MAAVCNFYPPENARFLLNSSINVHFKKSVKYNLKTAINLMDVSAVAALKPVRSK